MAFVVKYSHTGQQDRFDTYEEAEEAVRQVFSDASIGHSGDISDGGERTLCWADEESGENDDGARAVASIVRLHTEEGA